MTDYALPSVVDLLAPGDLATLRSLGRRKTYADGTIIHQRGDSDAAMGIVVEGVVKLYRQLSNGQQLLMVTVNPGQHYADNHAFGSSRRTHHGMAVGETTVDHYPQAAFLKLMSHPGITRAFYRVTALRLGHAIEILDDIRSLPPEVRLAKMIAVMHRSAGEPDRIECLQEELANLLGVSTMTLAKAIKSLRCEGLVKTGYRYVSIPDPARLDAWVEERNWD
jgi:CRP/FNR family transcriptional regulator, cyclic AMP receptor protein